MKFFKKIFAKICSSQPEDQQKNPTKTSEHEKNLSREAAAITIQRSFRAYRNKKHGKDQVEKSFEVRSSNLLLRDTVPVPNVMKNSKKRNEFEKYLDADKLVERKS